MAITSYFYNSVNGDRKYSADDLSKAFDITIESGVLLSAELLANPLDSFEVYYNTAIHSKGGKAIIKGHTVIMDSVENLTVAPTSTTIRKDLVVLEMSLLTRDVLLNVIQGDATNFPTLTKTDSLYQLPLAQLTVPANFTGSDYSTITITDVRQWARPNTPETANILWNGANYPMDTQTITPSKPLSSCRTGWKLVWSDYDPGVGANNFHWHITEIPKFFLTLPNVATSGQSYLETIPTGVMDANGNSKDAQKVLYFTDTTITGHYDNQVQTSSDVCLRFVYEY